MEVGRDAARALIREELSRAAAPHLDFLSVAEDDAIEADVFVALGNPDLDTFVDFAAAYRRTGSSAPIVLAGGRGRGTGPLTDRILSHYQLSGEDAEALRRDSVSEADLLELVFHREGIPADDLRREEKPSSRTLENFQNTRAVVAGVLSGRRGTVSLVTAPPLLLRARATALKTWDAHAAGWTVKRFKGRAAAMDAMSDDELARFLGYVVGYPQEFARARGLNASGELHGALARNNPDVEGVDLGSDDPERSAEWARMTRVRDLLGRFLKQGALP
jgi:hypothetical protein